MSQHASLLDQLLSGSALPEQYLGLAVLVVCGIAGLVNEFINARQRAEKRGR